MWELPSDLTKRYVNIVFALLSLLPSGEARAESCLWPLLGQSGVKA